MKVTTIYFDDWSSSDDEISRNDLTTSFFHLLHLNMYWMHSQSISGHNEQFHVNPEEKVWREHHGNRF
jgi:hypothetical protein